MAKSQLKTPLAVLRQITGCPGETFARLVGRGYSWLRKVESGDEPLQPEIAFQLSMETGVYIDWLMQGNPSAPPLNRLREEYTKEFYLFWRGRVLKAKNDLGGDFPSKHATAADAKFLNQIIGIGSAAGAKGKAALFTWKLQRALEGLAEEFGFDSKAARDAWKALCTVESIVEEAGHGEKFAPFFTYADRGLFKPGGKETTQIALVDASGKSLGSWGMPSEEAAAQSSKAKGKPRKQAKTSKRKAT